jgi:VCBS repeat-containing protein
VTITVNPVNDAPVLAAIGNQSVNEGGSLSIALSASDADAGDTLSFGVSGLPGFASLTDNGDGTGSIDVNPGFTDSGSYLLTVSVSDNGAPNLSDYETFTLTVNDFVGDDHGNNAAASTPVLVPSSTPGNVEVGTDVDWFRFSAIAGTDYTFETILGTLPDSLLTLFGTDGVTQIAFDDDSGEGLASRIEWTAPANGMYYLEVRAFNDTYTGTYSLIITSDSVQPWLILSIAQASISENGGASQATVTRSSGTSGLLTVALASSDTTEATVPSTVTIPDGADSAVFTVTGVDDAVVDGTQTVTITASASGHTSDSATVVVTDDDVNTAPVADADGPYVIDEGDALQLDGSGSSDPDEVYGDSIVSYAWDIDNDGQYDDVAGAMPTVPWADLSSLGLGIHTIGLRVEDSFGAMDTDSTTLSIYQNKPVAVMTANPNPAAPMQVVTFDGSGSYHNHAQHSIVSYEWDFDYDGTTFDVDASGVQVTHSYGQFGSYTAALRVTDDNVPALTDIDTVLVSIDQGNRAPVADANGPYVIDEGDDLQLDGSGSSDPDEVYGDSIVSYAWDIDNDGQYDDMAGAMPTVPWADLSSLGLGIHTIGLRVEDSFGATNTDSTTLTINPINNAPVANDDAATTDEDVAVTVDVLANDSDIDGDTLTVDSVTQPTNGSAVINLDGTVTYAPDADFNGSDSFTYTVADGNGGSDTATVTITVNPVNDTPVAQDDSYTTSEDTTLVIPALGILANDTDADGDTLTAVLDSAPSNGSLTLNADGSFTYTPDTSFTGVDTFTYHANDGTANSNIATVTITVYIPTPTQVVVDDLVSVSGDIVRYDRQTGQSSVEFTITNTSDTAIEGPIWLVIENISDPNITLANSDGTTSDGKLYIDLSTHLDDGRLDPGESVTIRLYFNNPDRLRFTFESSVLGVILP